MSDALSNLLGPTGGPVRCRVFSADLAIHWFATTADAGDPCVCGETIKAEEEQ